MNVYFYQIISMIHEVKKKIQKLFTWYKCTKFNAGLSEDENGNLINRAIFFNKY